MLDNKSLFEVLVDNDTMLTVVDEHGRRYAVEALTYELATNSLDLKITVGD